MKHPNREEWMSYLYDELEVEPRRELERHLGQCGECRASLAAWRHTSRQLNAFKIATQRQAAPPWQPLTRWALVSATAAAVLLGGIVLGRVTGVSRAELEATRRDAAAQAAAASRAETQQVLRQFALNLNQRLDTLETQQARDYSSLRKELETVAVLTEASFRQTENRIGRLANNTATPISQPTP
jgi:anti-sigma factor RsiW